MTITIPTWVAVLIGFWLLVVMVELALLRIVVQQGC